MLTAVHVRWILQKLGAEHQQVSAVTSTVSITIHWRPPNIDSKLSLNINVDNKKYALPLRTSCSCVQ